MSIHTYYVPDIMCASCAGTVTHALDDTPFKSCVREVNVLEKTLTLYLKDDEEAFKNLEDEAVDELVFSALREIGFDNTTSKSVLKKKKGFSHAFWGSIGLFSGFSLLLLPLFFSAMPFALVVCLSFLSTALTLTLGWPFYRRAYYGFWQGSWTMDTLFSMSTTVILAVSLGALFVPVLPMMFEAGLLIFGFRHVGIAIADAFKANLLGVRRFQDDAPKRVQLESGDMIALDQVKPGDKLRLSQGEILPVDGYFQSGAGMLSNLYEKGSNQSNPLVFKEKGKRKEYGAGTKIVFALEPLVLCVTKAANDSALAQEDRRILSNKLNATLDKKKSKLSGVAYWLRFFVPAVLSIAAVSGLVVGLYFSSWMLAIQCAACVLVAACPCTLGLIAPLVTHVGIKKIEKTGISFREPEHLDMLNKINAVMLDLNGTLITTPKVKDPEKNSELLALMAHLERSSDHWVANTIVDAAKKISFRGGKCTPKKSLIHNGHAVLFEGDEYILGNRLAMEGLGISSDALQVPLASLGESAIYLAKNGVLQGHVILESKLRAGALQMVRELQQDKKIYLCTGSDEKTAMNYATAFNIPTKQVFSDCTIKGENSKQAHLERLKDEGYYVATIGDAGNDATMLSKSHFGLVVEHEGGQVATQQSASAVLQTESLLPVLQLFRTAGKTASNINQNIAFSFIYNSLAMSAPALLLIGFGVVLNPAVGAALMILQTLLIFANVYRFDREEVLIESKKATAGLDAVSQDMPGSGDRRGLDLSAPGLVPEPTRDRHDSGNHEEAERVTQLLC